MLPTIEPTIEWFMPGYMPNNGESLMSALPIGGHISGHKPSHGGLNCGSIMPDLLYSNNDQREGFSDSTDKRTLIVDTNQ